MQTYNTKTHKLKRRLLRSQATDAELKLWSRLRRKQLGVVFRRQYDIGPYVVDFYCPEKRFAIEVDGGQHNDPENQQYDQYRTEYLEALDIKVIRFWNSEVLKSIDTVIEVILNAIRPLNPPLL